MRDAVYEGMARHVAVHWWFVGRRRILEAALEALDLSANARILEVGAGRGGNIPLLRCFGRVTALEPNPKARAWITAKTGISAVDCTLPNTTPLRDSHFDLIAMLDLLEHSEDATSALANLASPLAPGGRFLITATVAAAGLKVSLIRYFNTLLFPAVAASRLALNLSRNRSVDEEGLPPSPINELLAALCAAERHFVLALPMPFGVSLLAVLEAKTDEPVKQALNARDRPT